MQRPYPVLAEKDAPGLLALLQQTALYLWEEWPKDMQLSSLNDNGFVLSGECPHCRKQAAFPTVTETFTEPQAYNARIIGAARCLACNKYILGIVRMNEAERRWEYEVHYPLGWPDDSVAAEIPDEIKPDLQEALRCRWVKAYNATIEMCRRALESSCVKQGANPEIVLSKMIDWVHGQGKITTPLRDMAHKIKLGGNLAAHASSDRTLTEDDADAVLEFTKEYFQHVYVMPARMAKFDFDKKKKRGE